VSSPSTAWSCESDIPWSWRKIGVRPLCIATPCAWNQLSTDLKNQQLMPSFKTHHSSHLFTDANSNLWLTHSHTVSVIWPLSAYRGRLINTHWCSSWVIVRLELSWYIVCGYNSIMECVWFITGVWVWRGVKTYSDICLLWQGSGCDKVLRRVHMSVSCDRAVSWCFVKMHSYICLLCQGSKCDSVTTVMLRIMSVVTITII